MSTNGINTTDDADMSECDGENVVTMMDVLQEQEEFEEDANAVLGASDDKECTYSKGYIKRQAIYACLTCCGEAKDNPLKRAGVCLACSLSCHENHELVELYTKRNFRCDCGNPKFNSHPCHFTPIKTELNEENNYNQNFSGLYCTCHRPYPDPESTLDNNEMIQCIVCEDWLHASHLEATIPTEQYAEMICKGCMAKNKFIHDYSEFAVNSEDVDIETVESENAITTNGNDDYEIIKNTLPINDIDSAETIKDNETKEEMEVEESKKSKTETKPEDESLESVINDEVNKENEVSDKTKHCNEKENSANDSELKDIATADDVEKSDKSNDVKESEADTVCTDSKDGEEETVGSESKTDTAGADSKIAEPETVGSDSKADTVNADSKNAEAETVGSESKADDTVGPDNKNAEAETVGSESKDTEMGYEADTVGTDSKNTKAETVGSESMDAETTGTESKDIETKTKVIQPTTDNDKIVNNEIDGKENENLNIAGEACTQSTETNESSKVTSDAVLDSDKTLEQKSDETSERSIETENRSITEENVGPSEEKDGEKHETKCISENAAIHTEIIKESSENKTLDDTNNLNKMETDENVATDDFDMAESNKGDDKVTSEISNNDELDNGLNKVESASNGSEVSQSSSDQPLEKDQVSEDLEVLSNTQENKRKLSTEQSETDDVVTKKAKLEESKQCLRPKEIKKRFRGATFWPSNIRQKFCTCNECITMYKDLSVLFLIDPEDTVIAYETLGKEKIDGTVSQYEKGLQALSSLGRIQQINALTEYNKMRDKLLDFLKSFKERKEVVKEEDIKEFFAGMKPKREPDGVYFCR